MARTASNFMALNAAATVVPRRKRCWSARTILKCGVRRRPKVKSARSVGHNDVSVHKFNIRRLAYVKSQRQPDRGLDGGHFLRVLRSNLIPPIFSLGAEATASSEADAGMAVRTRHCGARICPAAPRE